VSPRFADRAAPAAFCWAPDLAGIPTLLYSDSPLWNGSETIPVGRAFRLLINVRSSSVSPAWNTRRGGAAPGPGDFLLR
jgi:hypothetical protein